MANLEWAHALAALIGAVIGAASAIFGFGWRLGQIEGRVSAKFQSQLDQTEKQMGQKLEETTTAFDETLRGIRQKVNDVELSTERFFLRRGEFDDFRKEYRQDIRDLKSMISNGH